MLLSLLVHAPFLLASLFVHVPQAGHQSESPLPEFACGLADEEEQEAPERAGPLLRIASPPEPRVWEVRLVEDPPLRPPPAPTGAGTAGPATPVPGPGSREGNAGPSGSAGTSPSAGQQGQGTAQEANQRRPWPAVSPGQTVVYLVDRSLSMGLRNGLIRAGEELLLCLGELPPSSRFQVLTFNRQVEMLLSASSLTWLQPNPATLQQVRQALLSLAPSGSTHHSQALQQALTLRPHQIVLVTDSDDLTETEIAELTRRNGGQTAIHVLDLGWRGDGAGSRPLRQLAGWNRGSYRQPEEPLLGAR